MADANRDLHTGEDDPADPRTTDTIATEVRTILLGSVVAMVVLVLLVTPSVLRLLNV